MKQYKLLKDIPGVKAGTLSLDNGNGYHEFKGYDSKGLPHDYVYAEVFMDRYPDFFEEVIELEKVFTIEDIQKAIRAGYFGYQRTHVSNIATEFLKEFHPEHIDQLKHLK